MKDVKLKGLRRPLADMVKKDLGSETLLPTINHSFPKLERMYGEDVLFKGKPIRTIVGQVLDQFGGDKCLLAGTDEVLTKNWRESDSTVGVPMNGRCISEKLSKIPPTRVKWGLDYKQFDAHFFDQYGFYLAELYSPGYTKYRKSEQQKIRNQLEARFNRLQNGVIVDINYGQVRSKFCGGSTGNASVTRPNIEVSKLMICVGVHEEFPDLSKEEVIRSVHRELLGDDSLNATNLDVKPVDVANNMQRIFKLPVTV
jgi:hypothetical protein